MKSGGFCDANADLMSPSTRREWIEILHQMTIWRNNMSPSTRREWIEMRHDPIRYPPQIVSLHTEGVD